MDDMMPMIVPWIALPTNLPMCTFKDKLAASFLVLPTRPSIPHALGGWLLA